LEGAALFVSALTKFCATIIGFERDEHMIFMNYWTNWQRQPTATMARAFNLKG
jgi:hypothetical protein